MFNSEKNSECHRQNTEKESEFQMKSLHLIYTYNIGYGVAKLYLSGKAISMFDFPEIEIFSAMIVSRGKNEIEITKDMVSESNKFVEKVEKFLK